MRYGWAYVNDVITGSGGTPGGSDKAIQFASGSSFSGSTNFTFDYNTNTLRLTGTLYADNLIVSSSQILKSGSTIFGDSAGDTHQFTGSVLVSGSLTATNTITATSASFLDYVQLGTSLSDEVYFNASSKTNIQPATTNTVDLGGSSRYWNTGYITTLSSSAISSSVSVKTGEITATSIILNGNLSSSGNINGSGLQIAGSGQFGGPVTVTGSVSASIGLQTAGAGQFGNGVTVTGTISSSVGLQTAGTLTVGSNAVIKNGLVVTGTVNASSFVGDGNNITGINGANVNGVGNDWTIQFKNGVGGTLTGSSNLTFSGSTLTLTGTLVVTGGVGVSPYLQLLPVASVAIPTNQTASYIYTSGSTNDIYFTQYQPGSGFNNTTRLRWIEGSLSTGLLHGGSLSTVNGTTTFSLTSGSGIIVTYNASIGSDPYPTINYVTWGNYISQSLTYSGSAPITYISIDSAGAISQNNVAWTAAQFKDKIVIGRVLHQSGAVTNGTTTAPTTAYGISSNTQDFFRAFGPLKVSGHTLAASGSTLSITKTSGDSYVEGRNYTSNPNQPNYILAANDPAMTTTKIYYEWVSGSTTLIDNNGGSGYSALRPNYYNNNGVITEITPTNNKFTVQRVYWFPKTATGAIYVYYGSTIYTTLAEAIAAVSTEAAFTESSHTLSSAIYVGAIVMEANTTNLTVTTKAQIVNGGLFRASSIGGSGGGGSTTPGGSTTQIQYNDGGSFNGSPNLTFDTTTLRLTGSFAMIGTGSLDIDGGYITGSGRASFGIVSGSVISGSSFIGDGSGLTNIASPKYAIFYANGVTTGSNYEIVTLNANKYLQLKRRKNFPTARSIGLTDSEYGWTWLNRSNLHQLSASTENISSSNSANFIHNTSSNTTWFGGTATAPVRYRNYNLQVGQTLQVTTKISAYSVSNYDQTQAIVWLSGSVDKYVRFGVGYDNGTNATAQSNIGSTTNHTLTSGQAAAGIWWTANVTPSRYSIYYNLSTGSVTPPTSGWIFSQGNTFVNASATTVGNVISVGQMIMTGKSDTSITSTGSFQYFDIQVKPHEEDGYFVPNSYYRWGAAQYDTSATEQLIGEFDLGSTSATIDQTKLRLALADLVNNLSGDSATVTWSAVQSSSSGASSSTYYDAASVVVSGTGRYFRLWMKVASSADTGGSIGPFPITIPIS